MVKGHVVARRILSIQFVVQFLDFRSVMTLLDVPHQMVFPSEALRTELTEKIATASMNHQVSLDVFAGEKTPLAELAFKLLLVGTLDSPGASVNLEVIQNVLAGIKKFAAHFAFQISGFGGVDGDMLSKGQPGIVLFVALVTLVDFLVRIVHL